MASSDISLNYIDMLIEAILDVNKNLVTLSETHKNDISSRKNEIQELKSSFNKGDISSKQLIKGFVDIARDLRAIDYDIKNSAKFNKAENKFITDLSKSIDKGGKIDDKKLDKIITAISNLNTSAMSGEDPLLKSTKDNKKLEDIIKEVKASTNKRDSAIDKVLGLMGVSHTEVKKGFRTVAEDIIIGLGASKFIGGALTDTFKLLGMIGGTYLNKICSFLFGDKFGKVIGTAMIIASQAIAPILTTAIFAGFANILTRGALGKLAGGLGKLIGGVFKGGLGKLTGGLGKLAGGIFKGGMLSNLASFFSHGPQTMTKDVARQTLKAGTVFRDAETGGLRKVVEGFARADGTKAMRTVAVKSAGTGVAKGLGKTAGKSLLKKIPGIGLLAGLGFGAGRALAGDWAGAGLEVASGAASLIPGWGTAASLAIDAGLIAKDAGAFKGIGKGAGKVIGKGAGRAVAMGAGLGVAGMGGALLFTLLKNHFAKTEKLQEESNGFWKTLMNFVEGSWFGKILGLGGSGGSGGYISPSETGDNASVGKVARLGKSPTSAELLKGKTDRSGHLSLSKMTEEDWKRADTLAPKYGSMGEIVNLGQMSKKRAQEVVEADIKAKGSKSFYEKLDESIINKGSFGTDIPYAARGTSAKFREDMKALQAAGFNTSNTKITSAIGTLGSRQQMSPHSYSSSVRGHFSSYGTTIDTTPIYNIKTGRRLSQKDLNRIGLGNYWLNVEGDHEHIAMGQLQWQKEQQKVKAEQHQLQAMKLVKDLEGEKRFQEIAKQNITKSPEELEQEYKKELMDKYGVFSKKGQDGKEHWYYGDNGRTKEFDPSGNIEMLKRTMTHMTNHEQ